MKDNVIREKSFNFALKVIDVYKELLAVNEFVLSKQFLRSGTSIGANVEEATAAVSRKDFIAKMAIASKEARETLYWIKLIKYSKLTSLNLDDLILDIEELIRILTAIIKTMQNN